MKNIWLSIVLTSLLLILSDNLLAQGAPPPPPDNQQSGNQPGGGAPLGAGLGILLTAAASYGFVKLKQVENHEKQWEK